MPKMSPTEFIAHLEGLKTAAPEFLNRIIRGVIFEAAQNVIVGGEFAPGTPVDTGDARSRWWLSIDGDGTPPVGVDPKSRPKGNTQPVVTTDMSGFARIMDVVAGQKVSLNNNSNHIVPLENGWSQQAPTGMVAQTANAIDAIVAKVKAQVELDI